jgi:DNA invertase Pin-like site-specific DNA recombinase
MIAPNPRMVAYMRVSTADQASDGYGLDAQRATIERAAAQRGWKIVEFISDAASGKNTRREGLERALELLRPVTAQDRRRGRTMTGADGLVVAKLDRLSRSVLDFAELVARADKEGWGLVTLDPELDLSTPFGRAMANVVATFAQLEREMIGQRTREGLAAAKAKGVRLGNAPGTPGQSKVPADVEQRIAAEHAAGMSLNAIARGLNADGVPTALGGRAWYPATVRGIVARVSSPGPVTTARRSDASERA